MKKKTEAERDTGNAIRMTVTGSMITLVKLIAAAATASAFVVMSAFYSCTALAAKVLCHRGRKAESEDKKIAIMATVAALLVASAVFYTAGAIRLFFVPATSGYGKIPAIAIAAVSFYELISATHGLVKAAKKKDLFYSAMKRVNFTGALAAIALTQVAILSFAGGNVDSSSNAIIGVIAGCSMSASAITSAIVAIRLFVAKKRRGEEREYAETDVEKESV